MTGQALLEFLAASQLDRLVASKFARHDNCILTSKIAVEVGRYFGKEVNAWACKLAIWNRTMQELIDQHGWPDEATLQDWATRGAWALGCNGKPSDDNGYPFHVVVTCDGWFADYAVEQFARPERDIHIQGVIVGPDCFDHGILRVDNNLGTRIEYQRNRDLGFLKTNNWKKKHYWSDIAGELIRKLKEASP